MNTYNINDTEFTNSAVYQEFIKNNPSKGFLKIRAYAANGAVPISGLKVVVTKNINENTNVIFFEGITNSSGIIDNIALPAPTSITDNLIIPRMTTYSILATYPPDNVNQSYIVNIYDNLSVLQNVVVIPSMMVGEIYGS